MNAPQIIEDPLQDPCVVAVLLCDSFSGDPTGTRRDLAGARYALELPEQGTLEFRGTLAIVLSRRSEALAEFDLAVIVAAQGMPDVADWQGHRRIVFRPGWLVGELPIRFANAPLLFPKPGMYAITVFSDGRPLTVVPLRVVAHGGLLPLQ